VSFCGEKIITNKIKAILDSGNSLISFPSIFKARVMESLEDKGMKCNAEKESNPNFE
jgi:hypothetical protein